MNEKQILKSEYKKLVLSRFLDDISFLADIKKQKDAWILGDGDCFGDFSEFVCMFHEDTDVVINHIEQFNLSVQSKELLKWFYREFVSFYKKERNPEKFLLSKEWEHINHLASNTLREFNGDQSI